VDHVDHIDLVVSSLERSLPFYRAFLGHLVYVREGSIRSERGEVVVYLNPVGGGGSIGLREAQSDAHGTPYDRYAVGVHHIAFVAASRRAVDECARWLRSQDVTIASEPQEYGYSPGYYALFFHDPDGLKIELVHQPSDEDLHRTVAELRERVAQLEGGGS
jgi:catechol 2,3-dioxygenase-like lactoylglutathione lyase family enzyme